MVTVECIVLQTTEPTFQFNLSTEPKDLYLTVHFCFEKKDPLEQPNNRLFHEVYSKEHALALI